MVFAAPPGALTSALTAADDLLPPDGLPGAGDMPGPGWLPPDWQTGPVPLGSRLVAGPDAPGQSDVMLPDVMLPDVMPPDVMLPDVMLPGAVPANAGKGADDADPASAVAIPVRAANETLRGTDGDDTLRASSAAGEHWVYGEGGDDYIDVYNPVADPGKPTTCSAAMAMTISRPSLRIRTCFMAEPAMTPSVWPAPVSQPLAAKVTTSCRPAYTTLPTTHFTRPVMAMAMAGRAQIRL